MARRFTGTDKLQSGSTSLFNGLAAGTLVALIRRNGAQTDWTGIVEYRGTTASSFEFVLEVFEDKVRGGGFTTEGNAGITGDPIPDKTWAWVASRYDGSAFTVWLNGVQGGTVARSGNFRANDRLMTIGRNPDDDITFVGDIAAVGAFNVALSANELLALARGAALQRIRPGSLIGDWPCFGLESPEPDYSGQGNSMTVTGATQANHGPTGLFTPNWAASIPLIGTDGAVRRRVGVGAGSSIRR